MPSDTLDLTSPSAASAQGAAITPARLAAVEVLAKRHEQNAEDLREYEEACRISGSWRYDAEQMITPDGEEETAATLRALAARVIELQRALYMAAAGNQGGHSDAGAEIARLLNVPFPLTMGALAEAAARDGFDPDELWPWLIKPMRAHAAMEDRT